MTPERRDKILDDIHNREALMKEISLRPATTVVKLVRLIESLLLEIDELQAKLDTIDHGWMPIETAPKDGRRILLNGDTPTHWMPLPEPPKASCSKVKSMAGIDLIAEERK